MASLEDVVVETLDTGGAAFGVLLQLLLLMHDDRCMAFRRGSVIQTGITSLLELRSLHGRFHQTQILARRSHLHHTSSSDTNNGDVCSR